MDKIWLNLSVKFSKPSANKICGSLSFKFNKISPNLASFHTQILRLKFEEIYTQIWRRFSKFFVSKKYVKFRLNYSKILRGFFENKSANLHLNLSPILNLKSKNLQSNLTKFYSLTQCKFCALGFKKFLQKINSHQKFRAKI